MATNLVSEITNVLGPTMVSRISSGLGLDKTATQKAIAAAVPSLLAALISLVSKPQGATKLRDAVSRQEPGALSSLASVIGQSGQKTLIDNGSSALSSLLGGNTVNGLSRALGQYAGIGDSGSKSLMGLLGPVALGVLGNEQRTNRLDNSGLAELLTSQKDIVRATLPSGISKYLGDTDILDSVTSSTIKPEYQTSSGSFPWGWLLAALALLAIGFVAWRLLSGPSQEAVETTSPTLEAPYAEGAFSKLRGLKVGDVDVGALATSAVNSLYASVEGIKDETGAQAALLGLTTAASEFDQLIGLLDQLSPETRKALAERFASIRPSLDQILSNATEIPGVGAVIKPTVDTIRSKLDTLAKV